MEDIVYSILAGILHAKSALTKFGHETRSKVNNFKHPVTNGYEIYELMTFLTNFV